MNVSTHSLPSARTTAPTKINRHPAVRIKCDQCNCSFHESKMNHCSDCGITFCEDCGCLCSPMAKNIRMATAIRKVLPKSLARILELEAMAKNRPLTLDEEQYLRHATRQADWGERWLKSYAAMVGLA